MTTTPASGPAGAPALETAEDILRAIHTETVLTRKATQRVESIAVGLVILGIIGAAVAVFLSAA